MRKYLLTFSFLFSACLLLAQEQVTPLDLEIQKAQRTFDAKKYNTAATLFKRIYPKVKEEDKQNEVLFMIAESYRKANNFKQAFDWYEKLVNTKYPDPRILYSYGLLLKNFERYDEASRQFYDYLFEVQNDSNASREMRACALAQTWKASPLKFNVKNIAELNTDQSDYSPFYTAGKLTWSSTRLEATGSEIFEWTGQKYSDLFESKKENGVWTKPANLKGAVNSNSNEGVAWLDSLGTIMYFTQCDGADGKGINCKIYVTYFQNNAWTAPQALPFSSDSFSVGHPAMSRDGKRMFFASDMKGGYGEKDLYYVDYDMVKDKWGTPVNLGPNVNTNDDDMFPFVDEHGVIYYASKGFTGMGGLDLYRTQDSAGTYKKAENLRYPINSGGDDFSISFVPEASRTATDVIAYVCSNREGGKGDDDLYAISVKPYVFVLKGKVFDQESAEPLAAANVTVTDEKGNPVFTVKTGPSGEFVGELPLNDVHTIIAKKDKYFSSASIVVSTKNISHDSTLEIRLTLSPIPEPEVDFTLQGIYYDLDKWDLRPESKVVLDSLATILKNNPTIVIELASHTDSRAAADYNMQLSEKRARSCVDYLIQKGIPKERMVAKGYGETRLVNDCTDDVDCTEAEHQQNRRTTFRVLRTDYKPRR